MFKQIAPVAGILRSKSLNPRSARPKLPAFQRARLRAKIAAVTCSEPWTELAAAAAETQGVDPSIANVARQIAARGIYPPPSEPGPRSRPRIGAVRMRRCDACGRMVPPNNMASFKLIRLCDDCRIEPDADLDETAQKPTCARTPGVQFSILIEGVTNQEVKRNDARRQLNQIGLTDPEITAMALICTGCSTRRIADMSQWSQTYVCKLLASAARKLQRSGLRVPKAPEPEAHRPSFVDPVTLDDLSDRVR